MTTLLLTALALAVVAIVAVLVVRDRPLLDDDPVDPRALRWPPDGSVRADDLSEIRFTVALRGYRMNEVDRVLDDLRVALAQRDAQLAVLRGHPAGGSPVSADRGERGPGAPPAKPAERAKA